MLQSGYLNMQSKMQIAILGSTGHIAKNLIFEMNKRGEFHLHLFARKIDALNNFINLYTHDPGNITVRGLEEFNNYSYDVIINCIGIGNPSDLKKDPSMVFRLTEQFDNLVLDYLQNNKNTLYLYFSSGAVYGSNFSMPVDRNSYNKLNVNHIDSNDFYSISKIYTEVKHRSYAEYNIVDLRVFGFFSQFSDLTTPYFLNELITCVQKNQVFITTYSNMIRDYIHPTDLIAIIDKLIFKHDLNDVFDVYSLAPISKFEIIELFEQKYNLIYQIENLPGSSPTGEKNSYYSVNNKLVEIGYYPTLSSLNTIMMATDRILNNE